MRYSLSAERVQRCLLPLVTRLLGLGLIVPLPLQSKVRVVNCDSFPSPARLVGSVLLTCYVVSVGGSIVRSGNAEPSIPNAVNWACSHLRCRTGAVMCNVFN